MTAIAILGSGKVATAIATKLADAGHRVMIGTREPRATQTKSPMSTVGFASPDRAIAAADIIFNATPGDSSVERLGALASVLEGKILVDVANATTRGEGGAPGGLVYPGSSLGEELQKALPATKVVKTLNTMLFLVMANPDSTQVPANVFLSGDDTEAKATVRTLLNDLGWADDRIEDLGGIESSRAVESFMLFVPAIVRNHGFKPFALAIAR